MSVIIEQCGNCFHQKVCGIRKTFSDFLYGDNDFHNTLDMVVASGSGEPSMQDDIEKILARRCKFYVLHTLLEDCSEGYWKGLVGK